MGSTAQAVLGQIISAKPISATEKRPSIPATWTPPSERRWRSYRRIGSVRHRTS